MLRAHGMKAGEFLMQDLPDEEWEARLRHLEHRHGTVVFKLNTATFRRSLKFWGVNELRTWKWVRLFRKDRFAQAASNYAAKFTGQWHRMKESVQRLEPPFDRKEFLTVYRRVCLSESRMAPLQRELGVLMPHISYEYLLRNPAQVGRGVIHLFTGEWPESVNTQGMFKVGDESRVEKWRSMFTEDELEESLR